MGCGRNCLIIKPAYIHVANEVDRKSVCNNKILLVIIIMCV